MVSQLKGTGTETGFSYSNNITNILYIPDRHGDTGPQVQVSK